LKEGLVPDVPKNVPDVAAAIEIDCDNSIFGWPIKRPDAMPSVIVFARLSKQGFHLFERHSDPNPINVRCGDDRSR
jgi:hypothetical protein